jgi:hypothetical protein
MGNILINLLRSKEKMINLHNVTYLRYGEFVIYNR